MVEIFTLDGKTWDIKVLSILERGEVLDTDESGRGIDGKMKRNIVGTFYNYTMKVKANKTNRAEYDAFFEAITAPVESHDVSFPHGQSMMFFEAYITSAERPLKMMATNNNEWGVMDVNFIASAPQIEA